MTLNPPRPGGPVRQIPQPFDPTSPLAIAAAQHQLRTTTHPCHHCGNPATAQWQRQATTDEAEQHWAATEANIRASNSGNPAVEYTADRADTVTKAVFGCGDHGDPCPGRIHDAGCKGHGHCRCVRADATPEQEATLREQHAEAARAATEGLAARGAAAGDA